MKNRVQFIGAELLALILAFGGCSNPLGEQPASPEAGSGGKLVIQLGDVDARTLAPVADSIEEYWLVLETSDKIESEEVFVLEDLPSEHLVDSADWTVNVYGLINDEIVTFGSKDVGTVKVDEIKPVVINLLPYEQEDWEVQLRDYVAPCDSRFWLCPG